MKVNLKKVMNWKINCSKLMKSFYQIVEMRNNCPKILFKGRDSSMDREPNRTNKKTLLQKILSSESWAAKKRDFKLTVYNNLNSNYVLETQGFNETLFNNFNLLKKL